MIPPRRLAVLHDSPDFGGHERAFLTWLPALLASERVASVSVYAPAQNAAFLGALKEFEGAKLSLTPSRFVKASGEPYRAPFRLRYGRSAVGFVQACAADIVLLLQGRIENLATPLLWLPRQREVVSYLPMAHSGVEMGRRPRLARLTDRVKRLYYARPQRLIVPSQAVAAQARRVGARGAIHVVENVAAPRPSDQASRLQARAALGLEADAPIALFMGRFDTYQKGLDLLLRDIVRSGERLAGWRLLFVGGGPAEPDIRRALEHGGVRGEIVGWTADPARYLAAADVLLAPSRFEGVPLVMLEALQQGLPILASDIDVYREYLPAASVFDFSKPVDLAHALQALTATDSLRDYRAHAQAVCRRLSLQTSQSLFVQAVLGDGRAARASEARIDAAMTSV